MIIRRQITSNFTVIPNEAILDTRLSAAARWLLVYLLSRPNDWQVHVGDIQKRGGVGREKAYRLIKELVSVGWVRKSVSREDSGQWGGVEYIVTDQPEVEGSSALPCDEKPYMENSLPANHHLTKDLKKPRTEKAINTEKNILSDPSIDADFDEFWSVYPKRPNNSKAAAKKKYILARKRGVPHVIIMAGVRDYATARNKAVADGDSPTYTQMAETWLNKECWENDYNPPADVKKEPVATDEELFDLAAEYPGHIGSYGVAQKLLADELSKGATIEALCEAARKYKLFCKGPPYEDRKIAPAMLEQWLKFKWREMDGYEFCTVGPDRIKTVRPKKAVT